MSQSPDTTNTPTIVRDISLYGSSGIVEKFAKNSASSSGTRNADITIKTPRVMIIHSKESLTLKRFVVNIPVLYICVESKKATSNSPVKNIRDGIFLSNKWNTLNCTIRVTGKAEFVYKDKDKYPNEPSEYKSPDDEDDTVIISASSVCFQNKDSGGWKRLRSEISNAVVIFLVSFVFMMIFAFATLNSLGALPGSLTSFVGGVGAIAVAIPFLSVSGLSTFVATRWKLLSKRSGKILFMMILLTSILSVVLPTWGYLGPYGGVFGCPLPVYPTFPAFLAGSQYIDPEQLYQKVVECPSSPAWSSLQTGKTSIGWDGGKTYPNPHCVFSSKGYEVTAIERGGPFQDGVQPCFFHTAAYGDFAYQVTMVVEDQKNQGGGGLVFRTPDPPSYTLEGKKTVEHIGEQTMYRTFVNVTGYGPETRSYNFFLTQDEPCHLKSVSQSPPICIAPMLLSGAGHANTLTVIVFGDKVYFYINGSYADQASNNISNFGYLGVFANANGGSSKVIFSNAKEWNLWL